MSNVVVVAVAAVPIHNDNILHNFIKVKILKI